ncbi:MAG: hypothetical protein KDD84_12465, partial [Caldilineaceae bacterium]|nr:hypothetical protein [Caldilineaceae bacterium]
DDGDDDGDTVAEERWLRLDHLPFLYLRLLLAAAVTAGLILLWVMLAFGWEADPPLLTPDTTYRPAGRDLRLTYQVTPDSAAPDDTASPSLLVSAGSAQGRLDVQSVDRLRLGNVDVRSAPADPALVVESWAGEAQVAALSLPGQSDLRGRVSFAFASVGSEESVLIPAAELGVRLVRLPEDNRFLVELVSSASDAEIQRTEINADDAIVVPYAGAANGELVLRFRNLPTLRVSLKSQPGDWLILPLLALALVGAAGLLRRPRFVLCQLAPWPPDRSVLVAQTDDAAQAAALTAWAATLEPSTTQEEDAA